MSLNRVLSFVGGLLSGALVGAAIVVLITPQSGAETRQRIAGRANEIILAGRRAMEERRQQLRREYASAIRIPLPLDDAEGS